MNMEVWTDFPERIVKGKEVHLGEDKEKFTILSFRKIQHWLFNSIGRNEQS